MEMPPGFRDRMQVEDAASDRSSSSISSPPISPQNNGFSDTIKVARPLFGDGVVANATSATSAQSAFAASTAAHGQSSNTASDAGTNANSNAPNKPKRIRRKKEVGQDGKPIDDGKPKERKPRRPREPKPRDANGNTTAAPRKRQKLEEKVAPDAPAPARQPTITEMVGSFAAPQPPKGIPMPPRQQHSAPSDSLVRSSLPPPTSNPSTPRPISSGQNFDPITGQMRPSNPPVVTTSAQTSPHLKRASASPSIASLIDPPLIIKTSAPLATHSPQMIMQQPFVRTEQYSPTSGQQAPTSLTAPPLQAPPSPTQMKKPPVPNLDGVMDADLTCHAPKQVHVDKQSEMKAQSKSSSSAPTPKPAKPTPPNAPKVAGTGLLSSSNLFGGPSDSESAERKGINIDIHIPLNPAGGNNINIAHEIVKKYGRDAINPRAAEHRARLLQIAAAANKIDGGSADDMSVDLMSELEGDSNMEVGGMDENLTADGKPRQRRKKVEEYDKEDDFIDDTELAWQEQAAVAKDGFFVYSGPLVPAGEAAKIEGTASGRGAGRGRGRGRGRGAAAAAGTTHASLAEKSRDASAAPRARARGRGTGAPRKPRITKADRERMEAEKADRERAAGGMLAGQGSTPIALAPTPQQAYAGQGMSSSVA